MQGKSFVSFFTIALLLVVSYIFILTIPTMQVESSAEDHANAYVATLPEVNEKGDTIDKEELADLARQNYLDSISDETVFNLGVKKYSYSELKRQQLALGLDLRGGMSVVMQVDLVGMLNELAGDANAKDRTYKKAIKKAQEEQKSAQTDFITLFGQAYSELTDKPMSRLFLRSDKLEGIELNSTNDQVIAAIRTEASKTVERTFNLLKKRIDKFGVTQPTVSLDKSTDRITVELPGVRSPERARKFLQQTANLEFWPMFTAVELLGQQTAGPYIALNDALKKDPDFSDVKARKERIKNVILDSLTQEKVDSIQADTTLPQATRDSLIFIEKENYYASDTTNARDDLGPLFNTISVIPPSNNAKEPEKVPFSAVVAPQDTSKAMKMLNSEQAKRILPRGIRFAWHAEEQEGQDGTKLFQLMALKTEGRKEAKLTGETVTQSFPTSNPSGFGYAVSLSMDSKGARLWKEMTEENVGKSVAVVLDGRIYSAPTVQGVIPNGNTSISGNFTAAEATDLANILSIGKLPAKPVIIEEAVVGPTLGQATVNAGIWALTIGFVLVLIFMLFYYGMAGILSVVALFLNIFLIFGCLASFGTVLTLPGIAGIVLTIGMAVDANVIIFERIREELRNNELWKDAVLKGFKHSYSAIIDANVTTFVVALILLVYGLGPIKGFATVLMIGVVCSVFSAVLFGRLLFDRFLIRNKKISVWNNATKNVLASPTVNFIKLRKFAYVISAVLLIASIVSITTSGFDLGVDFKGGRSYTVEFTEDVSIDKLRTNLTDKFGDDFVVKSFGSENQAKITTSYKIDEEGEEIDKEVLYTLYEAVSAYEGASSDTTKFKTFKKGHPEGVSEAGLYLNASSKVGPTIADDIQQSAIWASIFSLLFIFAYILIRFRRWQFSVGAIAALFHDVTIVLGLFSLFKGILPFSLEIDQAFIAAILTIIGYSINDTVIVFDRIRETATNNPESGIKNIVNTAINSTLSRTVITSLTTFFVVFILFLFGGDGIAGFAFALFVGIIIGTYSSMFIASPIVVDTTRDAGSLKYSELEDEFKTEEQLAAEAAATAENVETTEETDETDK